MLSNLKPPQAGCDVSRDRGSIIYAARIEYDNNLNLHVFATQRGFVSNQLQTAGLDPLSSEECVAFGISAPPPWAR